MATVKKAKSGFGMLSVKAGIDKNPNPTAADRIAGAKGLAKKGKTVKKAQDGKQVSIPKKLAPKGADEKIKDAFGSGVKKYNDSSVLKSTKTYKSGGKAKKGCMSCGGKMKKK